MAFDPKRHVIKVQGNREYLPVSARLVWFRSEHPDWGIVTEPVEINLEKQYAIFSARIFNAEGRLMATATKMENVRGFADFIEKAECVPLSTRILTAEGWKTYDQLRLGEQVASYDKETDALVWGPLLAVRQYKNAPVVRASNGKGFDVVCTPDHKWAVKYQAVLNGKMYRYQVMRETQTLKTSHRIVTAAASLNSPKDMPTLTVTPEQAFVMGMLITDGSLRYSGKHISGYICQSKPDNVSIIREQLKNVPHREDAIPAHTRTFPTGKTYDCQIGYRWHPSAAYLHDLHDAFGMTHETELPQRVALLSVEARKALLWAMTLAESDERGNFAQMPGRNDWIIDLWTALCALEGSMVCKAVIRPTCGGIWVARRKKTRHVYASNLTIEDAGQQDVWCPQTQFGTWVARFENDVVTITGNTGSVGRALAMCGYGTQFAPELEEGGRMADSPYPMRDNRFASRPASPANRQEPPRQERQERQERPENRQEASYPANGNGNGNGPRPLSPRPAPAAPPREPMREEREEEPFPEEESAPRAAASAPAPAPTRPAPAGRPAPSGAGITRVREPEPADFTPTEDDEDESDPFADEEEIPTPAPKPAARPAASNGANTEVASNRCTVEGCTMVLNPAQLTMSMNKFGKPLCLLHQRDATPLAGAASSGGRRGKTGGTDTLL